MPTTKVATAERPEPSEKLTKHDRCDATASGVEEAFVRFTNKAGAVIDLCCHHADSLEASLIGSGFQASIDNRSKINVKPMSGSILAEAADTKGLDDWDDE